MRVPRSRPRRSWRSRRRCTGRWPSACAGHIVRWAAVERPSFLVERATRTDTPPYSLHLMSASLPFCRCLRHSLSACRSPCLYFSICLCLCLSGWPAGLLLCFPGCIFVLVPAQQAGGWLVGRWELGAAPCERREWACLEMVRNVLPDLRASICMLDPNLGGPQGVPVGRDLVSHRPCAVLRV